MMIPTSWLVENMRNGGMSLDPLHTALVIGYEIGDLQKDTFYAMVRGEATRAGYIADATCAAADAITQIRVLLSVLGISDEAILDMFEMGETRVRERLEEFAKKQRPRPNDELNVRGTTTGRLSYASPNLSNPPRHKSEPPLTHEQIAEQLGRIPSGFVNRPRPKHEGD